MPENALAKLSATVWTVLSGPSSKFRCLIAHIQHILFQDAETKEMVLEP